MNTFEAEQLFHRVGRFPEPTRNPSIREPASVQWMPRYFDTPPLLEDAVLRNGTGWGRESNVSANAAKGLRKIFA